MADACRELGSVFGCEGFGPGQLCFRVAALRHAGVAADGIHSGERAGGGRRGRVAAGETRAADPDRRDIEGTGADETMMRAVAQRTVTTGRRREAADSASGGMSPGGAIR